MKYYIIVVPGPVAGSWHRVKGRNNRPSSQQLAPGKGEEPSRTGLVAGSWHRVKGRNNKPSSRQPAPGKGEEPSRPGLVAGSQLGKGEWSNFVNLSQWK